LLTTRLSALGSSAVAQGRTKGVATMAISKAIPFLQAPAKLDGSLVGDFGTSHSCDDLYSAGRWAKSVTAKQYTDVGVVRCPVLDYTGFDPIGISDQLADLKYVRGKYLSSFTTMVYGEESSTVPLAHQHSTEDEKRGEGALTVLYLLWFTLL
jgi:hypothetical protein